MVVAPFIVLAATLAATAVSAYGQVRAGNAAEASAKHNAALSERNADIAEQDRLIQLRQYRAEAEDVRRANRRESAAIRTAFGASGVELSGSPLDVLEDTAVEHALEERRVEFEGRTASRGKALEALGLREDAAISRIEGQNAKTSSRIAAGGTAIRGLSSAASGAVSSGII